MDADSSGQLICPYVLYKLDEIRDIYIRSILLPLSGKIDTGVCIARLQEIINCCAAASRNSKCPEKAVEKNDEMISFD